MQYITQLSEKNICRAWEIIDDVELVATWKSIGAEVYLVGSLKTGLLMKNLNINFHVYTPSIKLGESCYAMSQIGSCARSKNMESRNLLDTEQKCIEWHVWYEDANGQLWQIDVMHILKNSACYGVAEKAAERIAAALTPATKQTILKLKYNTPDSEKIMGMEYYMAVLRDGVKNYPEFMEWRKHNPLNEVMLWIA